MPHGLPNDSRMTSVAVHVAAVLYSNQEGWELSTVSIAEVCGIDRKAVRRGLAKLVELRWAAREALGNNRYVLHLPRHEPFDADEHSRLNTYSADPGGVKMTHTLGSKRDQQVGSKGANNSVTPLSKGSVNLDIPPSGDRNSLTACGEATYPNDDSSRNPKPMFDDWHPNGIHTNSGKRYGIHVKAISDVFKKWAIAEGERSSDWDRKFGDLLRMIGEGERCPDDNGYFDIYAYAVDPTVDWYEDEHYRWSKPPIVPSRPPAPNGTYYADAWPGSNACRIAATKHGVYDALLADFRERHAGLSPQRAIEWESKFKSELALANA